jgi:hypothetical protein
MNDALEVFELLRHATELVAKQQALSLKQAVQIAALDARVTRLEQQAPRRRAPGEVDEQARSTQTVH